MWIAVASSRCRSSADANGAAAHGRFRPTPLGPRKIKTQTRGERGPSPRTTTALHPSLGTPTDHHLGTPRPMRSHVTTTGGRFPGSRVVAFDRLPRDNRPQWLFWPSARRLQLRGQPRNCVLMHAHRIPLVIPCGNHQPIWSHRASAESTIGSRSIRFVS